MTNHSSVIKAIIFDFGGVLCFHPRDEQVSELAALCRLPFDEFLKAYWSMRGAYDSGRLSAAEYWRAIGKTAGVEYSEPEIDRFRRHDIDFWMQLDARMMEWVRQVRAAGIRTGLLSNLPRDLGEHLRHKMHLPANFDHHSFSYELGHSKPEPEIYQHAIQGLGVQPGEALFLDDRAENVAGAVACGIHALQFENPQTLQTQLAELNGASRGLMPVSTPPVVLE